MRSVTNKYFLTMVKWKGYFEMKKLTRVTFQYEDDTKDEIIDPRACLMFQSRCNTSGVLSGMEDYVITNVTGDDNATEPTK